MRYLILGSLLGLALMWPRAEAASRPQYLLYGRTSGGVNVPLLVASDGTLQTS